MAGPISMLIDDLDHLMGGPVDDRLGCGRKASFCQPHHGPQALDAERPLLLRQEGFAGCVEALPA